MDPIDPLYVAARSVLLDALEALQSDLTALILVGAQAVYLRTGPTALPVAPYTTDADVAIEPAALLPHEVPLAVRLEAAGFIPGTQDPGVWQKLATTDGAGDQMIQLDLMVPDMLVERGGRRSARLEGQSRRLARRTPGLEAALIDQDRLAISALDSRDRRTFMLPVAGPVALLLAKAVKMEDRANSPRQQPKDALDVLRLLQTTPADELADRLGRVVTDPALGQVTAKHAQRFLTTFSPTGVGMLVLRKETETLGLDPRTVNEFVQRGIHAMTAVLT